VSRKVPWSPGGSRRHGESAAEARERRRRILLDPPDHEPEAPGYLGAHGVRLEAVAVMRRGDSFRVLTETSR
jgi:hypothetical protein